MEQNKEQHTEQHTQKRSLDENQQRAVRIRRNAVVSAGAGSGKTTVLAKRFTYLITEAGYTVDQILTLTFTKKATVEMKGRIFRTLQQAAAEGSSRAAQAVQDFNKAQILTLDSYCSAIARQGSHFYGIRPDFRADKTAAEETIRDMAFPFLLEHRSSRAIRAMAANTNLTAIANDFFASPVLQYSTVAKPLDLAADMERQLQHILPVCRTYAQQTNDLINEIRNIFNTVCSSNSDTAKKLDAILSMPQPEPPVLSREQIEAGDITGLDEYLLYLGNFTAFTRRGLEQIKEPLQELYNKTDLLMSIANYAAGYPVAREAAQLLSCFQDQVLATKRATGILTFKDVAALALRTLIEHPEIRQLEKEKFKAIMIDEFQDNNSLQRDMLFMLAEKTELTGRTGIPEVQDLDTEKLFFVGDEKQSIYRFRGADVSVFRSLKNAFPEGNLELETNYRSEPALISAFNTMFGGLPYGTVSSDGMTEAAASGAPAIFCRPAHGSPLPDYEAEYHAVRIPPSKLAEHPLTAAEKRVHIAFYKTGGTGRPADDVLSKEEQEAAWVADKITELTESGLQYSDIAILFRTTTRQPVFERMLMNAGIPYTTETRKGFFSDGPVNDLFSYLSLCVYPQDTNAYAKVLCSPFVNLTQAQAQQILALSLPPFDPAAAQALASQDAAGRFTAAAEEFKKADETAKTGSITSLLTYLWYDLGYRYETVWNKKVELYGSLYDMLFELARQTETAADGLASFIDSIRVYQDDTKKVDDLNVLQEGRDSVHLLTIHKSKGLEFPVVFVCGNSAPPKTDGNGAPVYYNEQFGISINTPPCSIFTKVASKGIHSSSSRKTTNYFYEMLRDDNERKAAAELRRLTYVAYTRAEKELYITGNYSGDFSGTPDAQPKNIYAVMQPLLEYYTAGAADAAAPFDFITIEERTRSGRNSAAVPNTRTAKRQRITDITQAIQVPHTVLNIEQVPDVYLAPSRLAEAADPAAARGIPSAPHIPTPVPSPDYTAVDSIINDDSAFGSAEFGTVVHAYLEAALRHDPFIPMQIFNGLKHNETQIQAVQQAAGTMVARFLSSPTGQQAAASSWYRTEYPFRCRIGHRIIKGAMDLVYRGTDGTYTIVDYKSARTMHPETYYLQLACYRKALSQITGVPFRSVRCCLYFLRFDTAIDISDFCTEDLPGSAAQL